MKFKDKIPQAPKRMMIAVAKGMVSAAVRMLRDAKVSWPRIEKELRLVDNHGMNAWRYGGNKHAKKERAPAAAGSATTVASGTPKVRAPFVSSHKRPPGAK